MSERLMCECGQDINPKFDGDMGFLFHVIGGHKVTVTCDRMIGTYPCCSVVEGDCRDGLADLVCDAIISDPPYAETSLSWDLLADGWVACISPQIRTLWCFGSMRFFLSNSKDFKGWKFAQELIWEKQNGSGFAVERFNRVHEIATHWYRGEWAKSYHEMPRTKRVGSAVKNVRKRGSTPHRSILGPGRYHDDGMRIARSVQQFRNEQGRALHPTQKPLGFVEMLVSYSVPAAGIVIDPFCGSGTTLVAAKKLGRHFLGFEISHGYCEIARKRLAEIDAQPSLFEQKPEQMTL